MARRYDGLGWVPLARGVHYRGSKRDVEDGRLTAFECRDDLHPMNGRYANSSFRFMRCFVWNPAFLFMFHSAMTTHTHTHTQTHILFHTQINTTHTFKHIQNFRMNI